MMENCLMMAVLSAVLSAVQSVAKLGLNSSKDC